MYLDALDRIPETARQGRLTARPHPPHHADDALGSGAHRLPGGRSAALIVPTTYRCHSPAPLVLGFHGANGDARQRLDEAVKLAETTGAIVFTPESQGRTWDAVLGRMGPDVARLDLALAWLFDRYAIDPRAIIASGFSDGASYALALGLTNGDLVSHVLAFSPGFAPVGHLYGKPRIFISHGTDDVVLPINLCSRPLVKKLRTLEYEVEFVELEGGHTFSAEALAAATAWLNRS